MNPSVVEKAAPTISVVLLLPLTCIFLLMLLLAVRRSGSLAGAFVLISIWLRIISSAYHPFTYAPVIGGLSLNALLSVATVGCGILIISRQTFLQRWIMPIYFLFIIMTISAVINGSTSGFVDMFFKWGYAIVLIAAIREAMEQVGPNRILYLISVCYMPVLILQALSVVLGVGKDTEGTNAVSYIGGYNHEAAFSVLLVTFMVATYLNSALRFPFKVALIVIGVLGVMLANYRTAIIAMLPVLAGLFMLEGISLFNRRGRTFMLVLTIPLGLGLFAAAAFFLSDRFADLFTLILNFEKFVKPPREFLEEEMKTLSGRLYIWANYINSYLNGTDMQLLFGFGPNSWVGTFVKYAHNTLVGYLYELGLFGVLGLLAIWGRFVFATFRIVDPLMRYKLLLAQAGFLLFNMATMPHWLIEGNILFAVIQATVLFQLSPQRRREAAMVPAAQHGLPLRV